MMKKSISVILLALLLFILMLSSCKSKTSETTEQQDANTTPITDSVQTPKEDIESVPEETPEETLEPISPINHYYNRGIYEKDGYIYRQFSDGLYRRQRGSDSWEQLCEVKIYTGRGLTSCGNRMYFTGSTKAADTQENSWNNAVFYLDLDTMECGEFFSTDTLVSTVAVYDGCLYLQYLKENWLEYEGWRLDAEGNMAEKLDPEAEDFICREQNLYNIADYETMSASYFPLEDPYKIINESKCEVIPLPHCAAVLNGKAVLKQRNGESVCHYFLRDLKTGEDRLLFDAVEVLIVTGDGIYYFADRDSFQYYSFAEQESRDIPVPEFWETDMIFMDYCLTYDENALYFYDNGNSSGGPRILRMSVDDWSVETLAQGEEAASAEGARINQSDGEYFYHGDQMYPVE